jgi:hypothetical protein
MLVAVRSKSCLIDETGFESRWGCRCFVSCAFLCCEFSWLCDELITREGKSYQVWASQELGYCSTEKTIKENTVHLSYKDESRGVGFEVTTVEACLFPSSVRFPMLMTLPPLLHPYPGSISSNPWSLRDFVSDRHSAVGRERKLDGPSTYLECDLLWFGASFSIQIRSYISYRSGTLDIWNWVRKDGLLISQYSVKHCFRMWFSSKCFVFYSLYFCMFFTCRCVSNFRLSPSFRWDLLWRYAAVLLDPWRWDR